MKTSFLDREFIPEGTNGLAYSEPSDSVEQRLMDVWQRDQGIQGRCGGVK